MGGWWEKKTLAGIFFDTREQGGGTEDWRVTKSLPVNKGEVAVGVGEKRGYLF